MKHIPFVFGYVYCLGLIGLSMYNTRKKLQYYDPSKNKWI
jgi:hypothetical protein